MLVIGEIQLAGNHQAGKGRNEPSNSSDHRCCKCYGGCDINPFGHAKPTFAYSYFGNLFEIKL